MPGLLSLANAIRQAGMFLSHPPMVTTPSMPSAPTTVSTESAITSLETREYLIPGVPILMPSDTVMVPNGTAFPPDSSTPRTACLPNSSRWALQGVTMLQAEQTATCGLSKSSSSNPTALSMERLGARSVPSTTMEEKGLLHELFICVS